MGRRSGRRGADWARNETPNEPFGVTGRVAPRPRTVGWLGLVAGTALVASLAIWPKNVEPAIVDRSGVPDALYEKFWVGGGQVGQVGTTARIVLPEDELVLGADAGRVASLRINPGTSLPMVGPAGVTVIVRDVKTGATLRRFNTAVHVSSGLLAGSLFFWIGRTLPLNAGGSSDAGVWVVDLAEPRSTPTAVIPPTDLSAVYGPDAVRGRLRLSDGGRAVLTLIQSPTARATDIIDVESLTLRQTLEDEFALEVLDGSALVIPLHGDPRGDSRRVRVLDLETGRTVGPGVLTDDVFWSVTGNGEVFIQHARGGAGSIIAINLGSGAAREILAQVTLALSHALSTPESLVLVDLDWEVGADGKVHQPITLLDPGTGEVKVAAFTIGNP